MRRIAAIMLAIVVLGAAFYFGGRSILPLGGKSPEPTPAVLDASASPQEVAIIVTGRVVPKRWVELAFGRSGRIKDIPVEVGDTVEQDESLALLEPEDFSLDLRAAEQDLDLQEARLAQAKAKAEEMTSSVEREDIVAAQAELAGEQAALEELLSLPSPTDVEEAEIRLEMAKADLQAVQSSRNALGGASDDDGTADVDEANAQVAVAEMIVKLAELDYRRAQEKPGKAQMKAAEARVARAEATLAALQRGVSDTDLRILELQVAQARTRLEQSRLERDAMLAASQITAPFPGLIVSVNAHPGEFVTGQVPIVLMADMSEFVVETTDLDEWDLKRVRIGESLDVKVAALENRILPARVTAIAPRATASSIGDVVYTITLALDKQDSELRWGMSVRVDFPPPPPQAH